MKIFNIGDKVWYAKLKSKQETLTCPECFGKKCLTVILGDDSKVTIDCAGCSSGYNPPKGYVTYWKQDVDVPLVIIEKVNISKKEVEYYFNDCYYAKDTDVFSTKEEAEIRAKELAEEHNKQELNKIYQKEKNNRNWSWHVYYYRNMIRNAEKDIERAKAKLDVAKEKAKLK